MKMIPLGASGKTTVVDDEDFHGLAQFPWHLHPLGYAYRVFYANSRPTGRYMHRLILGSPDGVADHINRDPLDNRKCNLRVVGKSENALNQGVQRNNTSGHRGIDFDKRRNKWSARIQVGGKPHYLGRFATKEEAVIARKQFIAAHCLIAE